MIEKGITNNRRDRSHHVIMVMENNGKNSVRDLCVDLHLEKNNNLWGDEDNHCKSHPDEFIMVKKNGKGRHKLTLPRLEINTRAMSVNHNTTQ